MDVIADTAAAVSVLESARERRARDELCALTKECSVAPSGSAVTDAALLLEEDSDDEPDQNVHHGDVDDAVTDPTAFEARFAAVVAVAPLDEEDGGPLQAVTSYT